MTGLTTRTSKRSTTRSAPYRNFGLYTPLDFLAAVTAHIPDERLIRSCAPTAGAP